VFLLVLGHMPPAVVKLFKLIALKLLIDARRLTLYIPLIAAFLLMKFVKLRTPVFLLVLGHMPPAVVNLLILIALIPLIDASRLTI